MAKRMKSEQAETAPVIHNHVPSQAATIFAISTVAALVVTVLYFWLSATIEKALGVDGDYVLVGMLLIPLFVYACAWGASRLWNSWQWESHQRRLELERERRETLVIQHKFYSSLANRTREVSPELKRRNEFIFAVVQDGLSGKPIGIRPSGESIILSGDTAPVGKDATMVKDAFAWMTQNGVAAKRGNRYVLTDGTTLLHVENLLHAPIMLNTGLSSSSSDQDYNILNLD